MIVKLYFIKKTFATLSGSLMLVNMIYSQSWTDAKSVTLMTKAKLIFLVND